MTSKDPIRISNRTRSLFIGIDYKGTPLELDGCLHDVNTMIHVLKSVCFPLREACTLVDDPVVQGRPAPTRDNILRGMEWLVHEAQAGDTLLLYYTGHTCQSANNTSPNTPGSNGWDGFNETIVPIDYQQSGVIIDDEIYNILISGLPVGVRLTVIMDCCHGGSLMDFPHSFEASLQNTSHSRGRMNTSRRRFNPSHHLADVVMFSGCLDSRSTQNKNSINKKILEKGCRGGGAFTNAFAHVISRSLIPSRPFMMLLVEMREVLLRRGVNQLPHLAATKAIDMARPFSFTGSLPTFTASTTNTPSPSPKHVEGEGTKTPTPVQQPAIPMEATLEDSARSYQAARRRQIPQGQNLSASQDLQ